MKKKTIIKVSLFVLIPTIFILLIIFTNNKLSRCGRDPYNFLPETELAKAVYWCEYEKVKDIVNQGVDVNSIEGDGATPLHLIVHQLERSDEKNCIDTFKLLIKSGANVNAQNNYGETPLHITDDYEVIALLLQANANPNIRDNKGYTPIYQFINLHNEFYAIHKMELLLKHGARIDIKDNQGNTPLSLAKGKTLELLKKYEKRQ